MRHDKRPDWLKIRIPSTDDYLRLKKTLQKGNLHTICESGKCPNMGECWKAGTATFLILGNSCTRNCRFCAVDHSVPLMPDNEEPLKLAMAVKTLNLKHVVLTSVTRDDLPDEGASHWNLCISELRRLNEDLTVEVLVPDFNAKNELIDIVLASKPHIFSHNLETVRRLTSEIRSKANYNTSLQVLSYASSRGFVVKSGLMMGLGETIDEVKEAIWDMKNAGCSMLTIGQYLRPDLLHYPVQEYVHPETFAQLQQYAFSIGFKSAFCGPLVRSSYHASTHI